MGQYLNLWYFNRNFGDALNKPLVEAIAGKEILRINEEKGSLDSPAYSAIGSIIQFLNRPCIVWGSGIIGLDYELKAKPREVLAVRGPLTRKRLLDLNISCPEVYGDPALILPRYFPATKSPTYELGIVPHYVDADNQFLPKDERIKIINVYDKPMEVVKQILDCRRIMSSSLHGLIVADAYRIPSLWLKFSRKIFGKDFKFYDYYASIGCPGMRPYIVNAPQKWLHLMNLCSKKPLVIDLEKLIASCPFLKNPPLPKK